jgi:hypothetical protein
MTRHNLVSSARALVAARTPYAHQGRNPALGLDCVGVLTWSLLQCGYIPRNQQTFTTNNYSARYPDPAQLALSIGNEADPIDAAPIPGDIYLMRLGRRELPQHVALISRVEGETIYIIHTHQHMPFVSEHRVDDLHAAAVAATFRLKEFSGG